MIRSVNNYPVSQLFDPNLSVVYHVPRYQREYTWQKPEWEALFDDLIDNAPGYYLGSIICINQAEDTLDVQKLEVVDGQQRLTTLSLVFAATVALLQSEDLDDDQRTELVALKRKLILKGTRELRLLPQMQNDNQNDYRNILREIGVLDEPRGMYDGRRRLPKAFAYFKTRIAKIRQEEGIDALLGFVDKLHRATLVKIEVLTHSDAYTLFESLNNRGVPLTAIDLIKNKLLAKIESTGESIDQAFDHWNKLLGDIGDDYAVQERFFRHYYNGHKHELSTIINVPVARRSNLMKIYETLIQERPKETLQDLCAAGLFYAVILGRREVQGFGALKEEISALERVQGSPSYLLLLFLLRQQSKLGLSVQHLTSITRLLIAFFVRRNLTDAPPTRDLTRIFMNLVETVREQNGPEIVESVKTSLRAVSSSDENFKRALAGAIYEENTGVCRFVLCRIAEMSMTAETRQDLWIMKGKNYLWTIEHIFPQGERIPEPWVQMVAGGDETRAKQLQREHVHRLGNLTLTGFNATLGNKPFVEKRDRTDERGNHVGFRNGLALNEDLKSQEVWTIEKIEARTEKLVARAMQLFQLA